MGTIFRNYKNSKASDLYWLLLNLACKLELKRSDEFATFSNLNIY